MTITFEQLVMAVYLTSQAARAGDHPPNLHQLDDDRIVMQMGVGPTYVEIVVTADGRYGWFVVTSDAGVPDCSDEPEPCDFKRPLPQPLMDAIRACHEELMVKEEDTND